MARKIAVATKEVQPDLLGTPQVTTSHQPESGQNQKQPKTGTGIIAHKAKIITGPQNILQVIAQVAADPGCDVAKMQALLDMQMRVAAEQAKIAFTQAFMALQAELPSINQDSKIEIREKEGGKRTGAVQQSTPYASFNNIMRIVRPLLRKHGFTLSYATEPTSDGGRIVVKGFLDHVEGHQRTTAFPLPAETSGSKNNVQGWGSSMSYGKRYCTIALLNIVSHAPRDADTDGARPNMKAGAKEIDVEAGEPIITTKQHDNLVDAIEDCGVSRKKFCEVYSIQKVEELPAAMYEIAIKACAEYKARR